MSKSRKKKAELNFTYIKGTKKNTMKNYFLDRLIKGRNTSQNLSSFILSNALPVVLLLFVMFVMTACGGLKSVVSPQPVRYFNGCKEAKLGTPGQYGREIALIANNEHFSFDLHDDRWDPQNQYYLQLEVPGHPTAAGRIITILAGGEQKVTDFKTGTTIPLTVPTSDTKNSRKLVVEFDLTPEQCRLGCSVKGNLIVHKNGHNELLESIQAYKEILSSFSKYQRDMYSGIPNSFFISEQNIKERLLINNSKCSRVSQNLKDAMRKSIQRLNVIKREFKTDNVGYAQFPTKGSTNDAIKSLEEVKTIVTENSLYRELFEKVFKDHPKNTDNIPYVGVDTSTLLSFARSMSEIPPNDPLKKHHVLSANLYFANTNGDVKRVLSAYTQGLLSTIMDQECSSLDCVSKSWSDSLSGFGTQWKTPFGPELHREDIFTGWLERAGCFAGPIPKYGCALPEGWLLENSVQLPLITPAKVCELSKKLEKCSRPFNNIGSLMRMECSSIFDPKIDSCIAQAKRKNRRKGGFISLGAINSCAQEWRNLACIGPEEKKKMLEGDPIQPLVDKVVQKEITKSWMNNIKNHKTYAEMVCNNAGKLFIETLSSDSFERVSGKANFEKQLKAKCISTGRSEVQKNCVAGVKSIQSRFGLKGKDTVVHPNDEFCGQDLNVFKPKAFGGKTSCNVGCDGSNALRINDFFRKTKGVELNPELGKGNQTETCPDSMSLRLKSGKKDCRTCNCKQGGDVRVKITLPIGARKVAFEGNCSFSITGVSSKRSQGKNRLTVKKESNNIYNLSPNCNSFRFCAKVVR